MAIKQVQQLPIVDLFSSEKNFYYEIPKYQREYAWGNWQWEKLFDDLDENSSGYFIGTIICINTNPDDFTDAVFSVIDGQQRLTTLSILLAAIYKQMVDINASIQDEELRTRFIT